MYINNSNNDERDNIEIIQNAINIYDGIQEEIKNHFVINTLLKLGLNFNKSDIILQHIWNDIKKIKSSISYPLLIKCCIESSQENKINNKIKIKMIIKILKWMKKENIKLSKFDKNELKMFTNNISKLLMKCDNIKQIKKIHFYLDIINDDNNDIFIKNLLIKSYGNFNEIEIALNIFNSINDLNKDSVTLNSILTAYNDCNLNQDLLKIYKLYSKLHDDISHLLAIKACININNFNKGQEIINNKLNQRGLSKSIGLNGVLINFYGYFGDINEAKYIFDSISKNKLSSIIIGSMLKAYIYNNYNHKAFDLYFNIYDNNDTNKLLNDICHILVIEACINLNDKKKYKLLKNKLFLKLSRNLNDHSIELKNKLIDFYGNFGDYKDALNIFCNINDKDKTIKTIGCMMNVYCNNNLNYECIQLFENIKNINNKLFADIICYTIVFKACKQSTLLHIGQKIHNQLLKENKNGKLILKENSIKISLINMYGKCGMIDICKEIFYSNIEEQDISIWNAMINAYGINGDIKNSRNLLNEMKNKKIMPDLKTFISLIHSCCHCNDIQQANDIWYNEINNNDIKYNYYLITSLIDGYCKKGLLNDAYNLLLKYNHDNKNKTDIIMWLALLNGCSKFKNIQLGEKVYNTMKDKFDENDDKMISAFVLLSNMYA